MLNKELPYSLEAERSVIASMISDSVVLTKIADRVLVEFFYLNVHGTVVRSILELYQKDSPVDLVTVCEVLKGNKDIQKLGGEAYLQEMVDIIPTTANVEYYLEILKEKAALRSLIEIGQKMIQDAYDSSQDIHTLIDQAESSIFNIAQERTDSDFSGIKPSLNQAVTYLEKLFHNQGKLSGLSSGFTDLDKLTAGFQKSDLIVVAARPSMGKTAFCLNIAENMGVRFGLGVAFFSLEMSKMQLCQRMIGSYGRLDAHKLRTGKIHQKEFVDITKTVSDLSKARIFLDDTPSLTTLQIRAKVRRLFSREKVDVIIVDYLQLIISQSRFRSENRQNEIAEISRGLKTLARELDVPVIVISQLSRQVEIRGSDHRPRLSDLRDSGAIEQDADLVLFIYRKEYYEPDNQEEQGKARLILAKQRNGPIGEFDLAFSKAQARFDDFQKEDIF